MFINQNNMLFKQTRRILGKHMWIEWFKEQEMRFTGSMSEYAGNLHHRNKVLQTRILRKCSVEICRMCPQPNVYIIVSRIAWECIFKSQVKHIYDFPVFKIKVECSEFEQAPHHWQRWYIIGSPGKCSSSESFRSFIQREGLNHYPLVN